MESLIPEVNLLTVKKETLDQGTRFIIEPLSPGYGVTFGNSLRRILLSSLPGAAITTMKIEGVDHEFSHIDGMKEDVVELILNLKKIALKSHSEDPVTIKLEAKGKGIITTDDIKKNPSVEFSPKQYICTLSEKAKLNMELTIEQGKGYVSAESKRDLKLPLGTIAIDSIFSPIARVNFVVENTRVGRITNFDKLILDIITNDTISGEEAFATALKIFNEHIDKILSSESLTITKIKKQKSEKKEPKKKTNK